ncbi:peptidase T [Acidaminobacter sp. JC074]|uniref:peptidase T n=1 Tax=Acidaminobacter sp. JC074 TaxID=2530199 RepID=UPI001F0D309D|nr:peptidase T [Acidaminobacter sp. JC074]MCH4890599.1 peptidase T [Acidaminobacter sp. JC074]
MSVVERFLKYVKVDTKSDPNSETCPSTDIQKNLGEILVTEMNEIGLSDVYMDEHGYVYGTLKANVDNKPSIGLIAHMDTSPDFSGKDVKPQIVENYDGNDIVLNSELDVVMTTKDFPSLKKYVGQTLITTDGTTLLGADNKAGIAEIIAAVDYLKNHPEIKHGDVKVGFTPDEEIGRGANLFNVEKFAADFAYTVDGGELGGIEYENFNAAGAKVKINGRNIHPGAAKDKMINAVHIGNELSNMLPMSQRPEHTELYEGFIHLNDFNATVEHGDMLFIIRDHDMEKFEHKKLIMKSAVDYLNIKYGQGTLELDMKDSYYNMREKVVEKMHIIDTAKEAMKQLDIEPQTFPVRGGTDGARLSYMGLVTPNLFTGGANFHGKFEYIVKESMEKAVDVIVKIVEIYGQ